MREAKGETMKKSVLLCTILWLAWSVGEVVAQSAPTGAPVGSMNTRSLSTNRRTLRPVKRVKQGTKKIRQAKPKPVYQ